MLTYITKLRSSDTSLGKKARASVSIVMKRTEAGLSPESAEMVSVRLATEAKSPDKRRDIYEGFMLRDTELPAGVEDWAMYATYKVPGKPDDTDPLHIPGTSAQGFGLVEEFSVRGFQNVSAQMGGVLSDILHGRSAEHVVPPVNPGMTNGYNQESANALRRGQGEF